MGQTITSVIDMVSYAGDLRRAAQKAPDQAVAEKIQRSANHLEQAALSRVSQAGLGIGELLDTFV
jgi:hypothetical protein